MTVIALQPSDTALDTGHIRWMRRIRMHVIESPLLMDRIHTRHPNAKPMAGILSSTARLQMHMFRISTCIRTHIVYLRINL